MNRLRGSPSFEDSELLQLASVAGCSIQYYPVREASLYSFDNSLPVTVNLKLNFGDAWHVTNVHLPFAVEPLEFWPVHVSEFD